MGHFRPGLSSHVVGDFVREERYSVVAAMDINGIVATHTLPNAFNTEDFNFALELHCSQNCYNTRHKSLKQTPFLSNFLEKS